MLRTARPLTPPSLSCCESNGLLTVPSSALPDPNTTPTLRSFSYNTMAPTATGNSTSVSGTPASGSTVAGKRNLKGIEDYSKFWKKDSKDDGESEMAKRPNQYKDVVNGYYDGATSPYMYGWATSFHFCRFAKGEPFKQALARHEHFLALAMQLKPGMKVLDVG